MQFLLQWQHVVPGSRQHGEAGLLQVIGQLAGFEAAASAWEPQLLRLRMAKYEPELLDRLCLSGAVGWGRLSPHQNFSQTGEMDRRRIVPTSLAPISLFPREDREWLMKVVHGEGTPPPADRYAQREWCRAVPCCNNRAPASSLTWWLTNHLPTDDNGLWGSSRSGDGRWVRTPCSPPTPDGDGPGRERTRRPRHAAGRWSLLVSKYVSNGRGHRGRIKPSPACRLSAGSPAIAQLAGGSPTSSSLRSCARDVLL